MSDLGHIQSVFPHFDWTHDRSVDNFLGRQGDLTLRLEKGTVGWVWQLLRGGQELPVRGYVRGELAVMLNLVRLSLKMLKEMKL